jgi:hypothetical protein
MLTPHDCTAREGSHDGSDMYCVDLSKQAELNEGYTLGTFSLRPLDVYHISEYDLFYSYNK